jgi:hypothetical protein
VALHTLLRQGSEQVVKGFIVALKDPIDGSEVAVMHIMIKNSGTYVPIDIIRGANKESQGRHKVASKEHWDMFLESDEDEDINDRANPDLQRKAQRVKALKGDRKT